jgi:hypothetical protein
MSATAQAAISPPLLWDAEEIITYVSTRPTSGLSKKEILEELDHWQRLLAARWREEIERRDNPGPKDDIFRLGGAIGSVLGLTASYFWDVVVGYFIGGAGLALAIVDYIDDWSTQSKEEKLIEPVRLASLRREALILELDKNSVQ